MSTPLPSEAPVTRAAAIAEARRIDAAPGVAGRRLAVQVSVDMTVAMSAALHDLHDIAQAAAQMLVAVSQHQAARDDVAKAAAEEELIVAEDQLAVMLVDAGYIQMGAEINLPKTED